MNERIGTFCEKCREVVCRCAENEVNLKKVTDNVVRSKPSDSFSNWVEFLLGGSEEFMKMKEEQYQSIWDEVKYSWLGFEENNKHYISKEEEQLFTWFKSNYEPPKKKTT